MKKKILFIEPDPNVFEAVAMSLSGKVDFIQARTTEEAQEILKSITIDLISTHELTPEVLGMGRPVVIFSARLGLNRENLLQDGATEVFSKIQDWNHFLNFLSNFSRAT